MPECPFKVGDIVKRTGETSWTGVRQGEVYEVSGVNTTPRQLTRNDIFWYITLKGFSSSNFASYKFELASRLRVKSGFASFVSRIEE